MPQVKAQSIAAGSIQERSKATKTQSQMFAVLVEVNQHYVGRAQREWQEAVTLVLKCTSDLSVDRVGLYQEWLRDFYKRRMEDAQYAMEAARTLSGIEMKLSMGLVEKEDVEAAKAA